MIFVLAYALTMLAVIGLFSHAKITGSLELNCEKVVALIIVTLFAPLSLIGFCGWVIYDLFEQRTRKRVTRIINDWEHTAATHLGIPTWDWFRGYNNKETRYQGMRETVGTLTNDNLELLCKVGKHIYDIEKPIRDAVINEMVDRRLFGE